MGHRSGSAPGGLPGFNFPPSRSCVPGRAAAHRYVRETRRACPTGALSGHATLKLWPQRSQTKLQVCGDPSGRIAEEADLLTLFERARAVIHRDFQRLIALEQE